MRFRLLAEVLDLEWEMFSRVKSARPAACQQAPDRFRAVRGSLMGPWPDDLLASYRQDLTAARDTGRNLVTEKYARMDVLIASGSANPLIAVIVDIEADWQREVQERFPALYQRCCRHTDLAEDGSDFSVYLSAELETYGFETIEMYYEMVKAAADRGDNLAIEALQHLVSAAGYASLEQAEQLLAPGVKQ
jgi:hypothetical protein